MSMSGRTRLLSDHDADELAAALDLDVDDVAICRACLVHAIVRRLAVDLSARVQGNLLRMRFEPWPPREQA